MRTAYYDLTVGEASRGEIARTFSAYRRMRAILDGADVVRRSDTFQLQRAAYDTIRHATGLPARLVTNGIREYAAGTWDPDRLPLDEKLMRLKGVDHVSLATLSGRVVVGCLLAGYREDGKKGALSHLVRSGERYALAVPLSRDMQATESDVLRTEVLSARVSRLAAGLAALVVESLEARAPEAAAEQAINEIDRGVGEIRAALAIATTERKRYALQREHLGLEGATVERDARRALQDGREDLAKAGIGRLEDIEAQVRSLERLIGEVDGRIEEAELAVRAAEAARRDTAERVRIARIASPAGDRARVAATERIVAALEKPITDLPTGVSGDGALRELEDFGRARRIEDRLAAMRQELGGGD